MLNQTNARSVVAVVVDPVAKALLRIGLTPDLVTIVGTIVSVFASLWFIPRGEFLWWLLVYALSAPSDMLDGAMARMRGTTGPWGAFLDSTLDRISDGALFAGILIWGMQAESTWRPWVAVLATICLIGSLVVSYAKARAEGLGLSCNVGIAERTERILIAGTGLVLAGLGLDWALPVALGILAVLVVITVLQRLMHVRAQTRAQDSGAA